MDGFVPIPREFFELPIWREKRRFSRQEALVDLMRRAAFAEHEQTVQGHTVTLAPGEQVISERYLAERWGWPKSTVHDFMKKIERTGLGEFRPPNPTDPSDHPIRPPFTVLNLISDAVFRRSENLNPTTPTDHANRPPQPTKEEEGVNKEKEGNKETDETGRFPRAEKRPAEQLVLEWKEQHGLDLRAVRAWWALNERNGWKINGAPIRDPRASLLSYCAHYVPPKRHSIGFRDFMAWARREYADSDGYFVELAERWFRWQRDQRKWMRRNKWTGFEEPVVDPKASFDAFLTWVVENDQSPDTDILTQYAAWEEDEL